MPASLTDLIGAVAAERGHGAASHAVVGLPGGVDYEAGRLLWAPHLPEQWPDLLSTEWPDRPARAARPHRQRRRSGRRRRSASFGAGAASPAVAYLTISTGIGAGVVHGGRLLRGTRSLAEVGHAVIDWRAWQDGAPSTLEELGSGSGVARLARECRARPARRRGDPGRAQPRASRGRPTSGKGRSRRVRRACRTWSCPSPRAPSSSEEGWAGRRSSSARCASWSCAGPAAIPTTCAIVRSALGDDAGLSGAAGWEAATRPCLIRFLKVFPPHTRRRLYGVSKLKHNCNTSTPLGVVAVRGLA